MPASVPEPDTDAGVAGDPPTGDFERGTDAGGFGLYVHWPFCLSKCPYCDFNSHVRETVDRRRWQDALLRELDYYAAMTPGRRATSIFFGGGTPSLMDPATVAAVIDRVRAHWHPSPDLEITLEANPGAAEAERFAAFAGAGVNRLSLGVQSLDDNSLAFLGRAHDRAEALAALARARDCFPRYSFDLIYALPGQTLASWAAELDAALALAGDHLSVYQLTLEPGTAFHARWRNGSLVPLEASVQADLFEHAAERLAAAGLPAYEISNHARPGAACRHNLTYWRYGEYVGVGPGAHGRLRQGDDVLATRQRRSPEGWLDDVETLGHATEETVVVASEDRIAEMTMMGLRMTEGLSRRRVRRLTGQEIETVFPADRLGLLREGGFVQLDEAGLRATAAGRQRLDAVIASLLA